MDKSRIVDELMMEAQVNGELKFAAFPKVLTELPNQTKSQISKIYDVGPKSGEEIITPDQATKSPYSKGLVLYTIKTLSEADQRKARDTVNLAERAILDDEKYQELRGSRAGDKCREDYMKATQDAVAKKYKEKEHVVAWGLGSKFEINPNMFTYYWSRNRRKLDAPGNRKQLIQHIKNKGGRAIYVTPDPDIAMKRQKRVEQRPSPAPSPATQTPTEQKMIDSLKKRAVDYAKKKKDQFNKLFVKYLDGLEAQVGKNFADLKTKATSGEYLGDVRNVMVKDLNLNQIVDFNRIRREVFSDDPNVRMYSWADTPEQRIKDYQKSYKEFVQRIDSAMASLKG